MFDCLNRVLLNGNYTREQIGKNTCGGLFWEFVVGILTEEQEKWKEREKSLTK